MLVQNSHLLRFLITRLGKTNEPFPIFRSQPLLTEVLLMCHKLLEMFAVIVASAISWLVALYQLSIGTTYIKFNYE